MLRILGVDRHALQEANVNRIENFNFEVPNKAGVKYFSVGSNILANNSSRVFQSSNRLISLEADQDLVTDNDGVFAVNEVKWTNYLVTFEGDHADVIGLSPTQDFEKVANFLKDNICFEFPKHFEKESFYKGFRDSILQAEI